MSEASDQIVLSIADLSKLCAMVTQQSEPRASTKDKAVEKLHSAMVGKIGNTETLIDWDRIIFAQEIEEAFVILKRRLMVTDKSAWLAHYGINGLKQNRVYEIEDALDKGVSYMSEVQVFDPTKDKAKAKNAAKPKAAKKAKNAAKPKAAKKGKANGDATETKRKGRPSPLYGKKIKCLVKDNPRRAGTNGYHSMKIILENPNMLVEDFVANGGRIVDLKWDMNKGSVELV